MSLTWFIEAMMLPAGRVQHPPGMQAAAESLSRLEVKFDIETRSPVQPRERDPWLMRYLQWYSRRA